MDRIKKIIILLLIVIASSISFQSMYNSLIKDFYNTAVTKENLIQEHIKLSRNFIISLRVFGDIYFDQAKEKESELFSLLQYDPKKDSYNLDAVGGTGKKKFSGNLTGTGNLPKSGPVRDELNLAFNYNKFFSYFYDGFPDVAWLYYTSESNFINIYPWNASKNFSFSKKLKSVDFYTVAAPKNNPHREIVWTSPYLDAAGKGYMVTLSAPIYDQDTFKGVVSLDLTNAWLSKIIESDYESYLIDNTHKVLAVNQNKTPLKDAQAKINSLLKIPRSKINNFQGKENNKVYLQGTTLIFLASFDDAPWKLILTVPLAVIIAKSMLFTLPILLIGIFFFLSIFEIDKRKKTEKELANSVKELKSYEKLLKKAATYDFLTNTLNRRGLKERFDEIIENSDITKSATAKVSFLMGDIDNFKNLNDTYGHATGDKVLIAIAELMKKKTNDQDVVCRWGGEEFVIMLPDKSYKEAMAFAEDIRREIENIIIPRDEQELKTSMTLGVQEGSFDKSIEQIISEADSALYVGKANGRNQVVGYPNQRWK